MAAKSKAATTTETLPPRSGIVQGKNRGHITTRRVMKERPSSKKGTLGKHVAFVRSIVREIAGFAPYEKRIMEYLKTSKDKRARKLAKARLGTLRRAKRKVDELNTVLVESRRAATH